MFVGGKFVGGSDDTIKLLDAGKLLEQGQGGGSALPQELQQAVEKANKEFEVALSATQDRMMLYADTHLSHCPGLNMPPNLVSSRSSSIRVTVTTQCLPICSWPCAIHVLIFLPCMQEKQREASVPPDLSMEQFEAAKAVAKDMLAASGQLFALHWAGCAVCSTAHISCEAHSLEV